MSVVVCNFDGINSISHEQVSLYHGDSYCGGVAIAYKICEGVCDLTGSINKDDIVIYSAMKAPGFYDGIEFITKAISNMHFVQKSSIADDKNAIEAPDGKFYFEVTHQQKKISFKLKDGLLPEGFSVLARKCKAFLANDEEILLWNQQKMQIGICLGKMKYSEIFEIKISDC